MVTWWKSFGLCNSNAYARHSPCSICNTGFILNHSSPLWGPTSAVCADWPLRVWAQLETPRLQPGALHDPHKVMKRATVRRSESVSFEESVRRTDPANHDSLLTHTATYCWLVASQQKWKCFRNVIFVQFCCHTQQQQSVSETDSLYFWP